MGGTTICDAGNDKYQYIHISTMAEDDEIRLCYVGIFTCPCSNYIASRETEITESLTFDFSESNELIMTKTTSEIAAATTKGSCVKACTKSIRAVVDPDLTATATATVTQNEAENFVVSLAVNKSTLGGSYTL